MAISDNAIAVDRTPIQVVNSLPVMHGSGLTAPRRSQLQATEESNSKFIISLAANVQSHANSAGSESENLLIDAEIHTTEFDLAWHFAPRWQAGVRFSGIHLGSGELDSLISSWHSAFDLPDGDRGDLAQDGFLIAYDVNGVGEALNRSGSGLGDTQLSLAYQLIDNRSRALSMYGFVNLPTGDAPKLSGSESADYGLELAYSQLLSNRWAWHMNLGLVTLGDQELLAIATQDAYATGSVGFHFSSSEKWRWSAQLGVHTEIFDSEIEELNKPAWLMSFGLEYQRRWQFYFAEDVSVNRAPDFSLGLRWQSAF